MYARVALFLFVTSLSYAAPDPRPEDFHSGKQVASWLRRQPPEKAAAWLDRNLPTLSKYGLANIRGPIRYPLIYGLISDQADWEAWPGFKRLEAWLEIDEGHYKDFSDDTGSWEPMYAFSPNRELLEILIARARARARFRAGQKKYTLAHELHSIVPLTNDIAGYKTAYASALRERVNQKITAYLALENSRITGDPYRKPQETTSADAPEKREYLDFVHELNTAVESLSEAETRYEQARFLLSTLTTVRGLGIESEILENHAKHADPFHSITPSLRLSFYGREGVQEKALATEAIRQMYREYFYYLESLSVGLKDPEEVLLFLQEGDAHIPHAATPKDLHAAFMRRLRDRFLALGPSNVQRRIFNIYGRWVDSRISLPALLYSRLFGSRCKKALSAGPEPLALPPSR